MSIPASAAIHSTIHPKLAGWYTFYLSGDGVVLHEEQSPRPGSYEARRDQTSSELHDDEYNRFVAAVSSSSSSSCMKSSRGYYQQAESLGRQCGT